MLATSDPIPTEAPELLGSSGRFERALQFCGCMLLLLRAMMNCKNTVGLQAEYAWTSRVANTVV